MRVALGLVVVVGLALRVWGISFGLPYAYHVDEAVFNGVTKQAVDSRFRSLPSNFSAFQLIVAVEHRLLTAIEPALRALPLSPELVATLDASAERYNLVARLNSAILGAATAIPVYLLGARLWGPGAGLLAAVWMSTCYMHVRDSHFGVPDSTVCFLTISAAYAASRLADGATLRGYLAAGALAGLAVASKQLAWPVFILVVLFHTMAPAPRSWIARLFDRRLGLALAAGIAVYVMCVPQMVLHWSEFWTYWRAAQSMGARGGMDRLRLETTGPLGTYVYSLRWGLGEALFALSMAGLAVGLAAPARAAIRVLLLFPVIYFGFLLLPGNMYFARYTLSALPFLLLAAAGFSSTIVARLPRRAGLQSAALVVLAAAAAAEPVVADIRHDVLLTTPDTRTLAKQWVEENIPEGSAIMLEFWWFSPALASVDQPSPFSTRTYQVMTRGAYGLSELSNGFGPSQGTLAVSDYAAMGVEYIIANSYSRESELLDPQEDKAKREFYAALEGQAELVREFSPFVPGVRVPRTFAETYGPAIMLSAYERPGPVLQIYRLRRLALFR